MLSPKALAAMVARDPLCVAGLLRYANQAKDGVIASIEKPVMMVGEQGMHSVLRSAPNATDLLSKPSALWLGDENRDWFAAQLNLLAPLAPPDNLFVHSLFVKKRPWAVLICMPHPSTPLTDNLYAGFKRYASLLMLSMREYL